MPTLQLTQVYLERAQKKALQVRASGRTLPKQGG